VTLFLERLCHAGKPKRYQSVVGGVGEHVSFLSYRPAGFVGRDCERGGRASTVTICNMISRMIICLIN